MELEDQDEGPAWIVSFLWEDRVWRRRSALWPGLLRAALGTKTCAFKTGLSLHLGDGKTEWGLGGEEEGFQGLFVFSLCMRYQ